MRVFEFADRGARGWLAVLLAVSLGGTAAAQTSEVRTLANGLRLHVVQVDQAEKVSMALALPVGWRHDPPGATGMAELLRWWLTLAQRHRPAANQFLVAARMDHTMVWHSGPARMFAEWLDFLADLMDAGLQGDADLHALALGRARLRADDQSWLVPGRVIRQKAWRTLGKGTPLGRQHYGIPAELQMQSLATVRARLRSHYGPDGAALVLIGDFRAATVATALARLEKVRRRPVDSRAISHDSAPGFTASAQHQRVDGPYVTAALLAPAPDHAEFLAFVLGITMLRSQAHQRFRAQRGNEWRADFPYLAFRYWDGDRLVLLNRRGDNGGPASAARLEIEDLLVAARQRTIYEAQLASARREVANILAAPPYDSASGPLLAVRARRLALELCLGTWPAGLAGRVEKVSSAAVQRALRQFLAPSRLRWFELTPTESTVENPRKFRR